MFRTKYFKRALYTLLAVFILMNVVAFFHAWKFTHFTTANVPKPGKIKQMSTAQKMKALVFGIDSPRPRNWRTPTQPYETVQLKGEKMIECWRVNADTAKGTVVIFHGYTGNKADMTDRSDEFLKMGYNTLLVDFMGSGGSEGNATTIGVKEAEQVKRCYDYLHANGETKIYLFGTSMGAAAILRAVSEYQLQPSGIIVECPFGTMYETTCARFRMLHVPPVPMAALLDFWGGVQNGFWAFSHNPQEFARNVKCPALLLYGAKDEKVSLEETNTIYTNLAGVKQLRIYPEARHENYLRKYKNEWVKDVSGFLQIANSN